MRSESVLIPPQNIADLDELRLFWREVMMHTTRPCVILLEGELGAGKTTSVPILAELQGLIGVQSPSYAIHLRYQNLSGLIMDHVDLYRLEDDDDLESSGFWDLFAEENSLMVIEWASRLDPASLPMNWNKLRVNIVKNPDGSRQAGCVRVVEEI